MSDAYGYINFIKSEDFDCKYEQMLTALNERCWNNDGSQWQISYLDSKPIGFKLYGEWGGGKSQYPTVFPQVDKGVILLGDNDEEIFIEHFTDEQYDSAWDILTGEESLENLVKLLSPFITKGWLEISCHAVEKSSSYMESFKLDYEGHAARVRQVLGYSAEPVNETFKLN